MTFYGSAFTTKFDGVPADELKNSWAIGLRGYTPKQIGRALDLLPKDDNFAPALPKFLGYCETAKKLEQQPAPKQLVEKVNPNAPEIAQARARANENLLASTNTDPFHSWAYKLADRLNAGEKLNSAQIRCLRQFEVNTGKKLIGVQRCE